MLDPAATLAALKPVFEDAAVAKVNQNIKYERLVLRNQGVTLAGVVGDPMVADYLLHSGERSHNLDELARRYLKHENTPITDLIGKKGKNQVTIDKVDVVRVKDYACEDADAAARLVAMLEPELEEDGLRKLYDEVEIPLIEVLAELEFNGVRLDVPFLAKLGGEMETQLAAMEVDVHAAAGRPFNVGSPKQLREVLFDEMKLPVQKRTGTTNEPSTDFETLEKLAALGHELPRKIIAYRSVAKLKGTYVDALPALVNPKTGRVHTSFNQTVAATGRLSSSEPNLQNVPARTEQGRQIRQAFLPRDGWRLLTADYSQVELRLLAHFCDDPQLKAAFAEDRDVHARVAAEIFAVPEADVTSQQRRIAKMVNFGVLYGMSPYGLAVRLGMTRKDAETFIDDYFARYPTVLAYQDNLLRQAAKDGYVGTVLGRRRKFSLTPVDVRSPYRGRTQAAREAINMEIQGSAADLMKLAMLGVYRRLKADEFEAKMLLSVHDELVLRGAARRVGVGRRDGAGRDDRGDGAQRAAESGRGRRPELAGRRGRMTGSASPHDAAVDRIAALVSAHFLDRPGFTVLSRVRWRPLRDHPDRCYLFDVIVVEGSPAAEAGASGAEFGPELRPTTVIDVVDRQGFEEEYYDKPDDLLLTSVCDYCLIDPTATVMLPQLYAAHRRDGGGWRIIPSSDGVFFTSAGFRLDVDGSAVRLRPCGPVRIEEKLYRYRKSLGRAINRAVDQATAVNHLQEKVRRLEHELAAVSAAGRRWVTPASRSSASSARSGPGSPRPPPPSPAAGRPSSTPTASAMPFSNSRT